MKYKPPFPWFGGKSRVSHIVWQRFGDVANYVEPFFGSGAVMFMRPTAPKIETVNDKDCMVANFFRAVKHAPDKVASWADSQVNEADLTARHTWLVEQLKTEFAEGMNTNPDYYDAKIAGWWVWGICCWIGSGWCDAGNGVHRQLPSLGTAGKGVHRKRPHLGNAGKGVHRKLPHLGDAGQGVHRKLPHLSDAGLTGYFKSISDRLRYTRVCCGDWKRVMGESVTVAHGVTGVFLDPPYSHDERDSNLYSVDEDIATAVRDWAIANGENPLLRIALCGYDTEHVMPKGWDNVHWKTKGGYSNQSDSSRAKENTRRETIWFSPHCLNTRQKSLF